MDYKTMLTQHLPKWKEPECNVIFTPEVSISLYSASSSEKGYQK
ncbi:MAG: hypothetical protein ACPGSD_00620 [Flavobacteriales bacterium]